MTDKTLGDYGKEIEKAVANGSCADVPKVVAEMKASLPPKPPVDPNAPPAPPPEPPAPVNQGKEVYIEKLTAFAESNNVFQVRLLAEEMVKVEPPTPPPPPAAPAPAPVEPPPA